jgi:methyltransferase (TIGR00027 family)
MDKDRDFQPDSGAILSGAVRAIEWEKPAGRRICEDPYARALIGDEGMEMAAAREESEYAKELRKFIPDVRLIILLRTRYIDDCVKGSIAAGAQQVVILGAGYDSRALRMEELKKAKVFEIDTPEMSWDKQERVKRVLGSRPAHVGYVGIDFISETLEALKNKLCQKGYVPAGKSLFILEGLVSHLTEEAVGDLFAFIASFSAKDSSLVCTYPHGDVVEKLIELRSGSEPTFGLNPPQMALFLEGKGFHLINNSTVKEVLDHYRFDPIESNIPYSFVQAMVK